MYEFDLSTVSGFLDAMWQVAGGVLSLDPQVFTAVIAARAGWVAVAILLVAGVSDMLGQSVVLFANRVSFRRFWVSLFMSALVVAVKAAAVKSPSALPAICTWLLPCRCG